MDRDERLKLSYEETTKYFHALADARFKLLALVPIATGTAIGLLRDTPPDCVIAVSLLGLIVTVGLVCYDQRNTQIYDAMMIRAKVLEALLGFDPVHPAQKNRGGAFLDRPERSRRLFEGVFGWRGLLLWHDRGLALIYGAALGGWTYLLANSVSTLLEVEGLPQRLAINLLLPVIVTTMFVLGLQELDEETDPLDQLPPHIRELTKASEESAAGWVRIMHERGGQPDESGQKTSVVR